MSEPDEFIQDNMQQVAIEEFLSLASQYPVLDVRSPGEYAHGHIPGAYALPLFSDEERKIVGTLYIQESRAAAIKAGLDFFGVKMRGMVEQAEQITASHSVPVPGSPNCVLVHCWRGGMRSAAVSWLLATYGFKVYTLTGGYKSFRNHVLKQLERSYSFKILGGYTGSGKTAMLRAMAADGHAVIDLERLAHHKGSAFGGLGEEKQPSYEMFENELGMALYRTIQQFPANEPIWLEDESRRIGDINLPNGLWHGMRQAPLYFIDMPFEDRLGNIVNEYGAFGKEEISASILRIQKRLGSLAAKNAMNYMAENNCKECFRILLQYYDKYYAKDIHERSVPVYNIACTHADVKNNIQELISKQTPA